MGMEVMRMEAMRAGKLENCENCRYSFWADPEKTLLCGVYLRYPARIPSSWSFFILANTPLCVCSEWKEKDGLTWV